MTRSHHVPQPCPRQRPRCGKRDGSSTWRHVDCAKHQAAWALAVATTVATAELGMLDWIHRRAPGVAVPLARAATVLGDTPVVWTAVGASALLGGARSRRWMSLLGPVCTLAAASATRHALAEVIDRPRPPDRLWRASWSGPSFPSRHTTLGTVGAGLVARLLTPGPRAHVVVWPVAAAVGVSRLVLGVHWPSDVVGGWVFAAATLALTRRGCVSPLGGDVAVGR